MEWADYLQLCKDVPTISMLLSPAKKGNITGWRQYEYVKMMITVQVPPRQKHTLHNKNRLQRLCACTYSPASQYLKDAEEMVTASYEEFQQSYVKPVFILKVQPHINMIDEDVFSDKVPIHQINPVLRLDRENHTSDLGPAQQSNVLHTTLKTFL